MQGSENLYPAIFGQPGPESTKKSHKINFSKQILRDDISYRTICEEIDAEDSVLLCHADLLWLSKGKVLDRVFELRQVIEMFLREKASQLLEYFAAPNFAISLAYLTDIFDLLNLLKISLQGRGVTILDVKKRSNHYRMLPVWRQRVAVSHFCSNLSSLSWIKSSLNKLIQYLMMLMIPVTLLIIWKL